MSYMKRLTPRLRKRLEGLTDLDEIIRQLKRLEGRIAICFKKEEYIDCDEMAEILSSLLSGLGVDHDTVVGNSDEGSSHAWVRIGEVDIDPTDQGFGDGTFNLCEQKRFTTTKERV